MPMRIVVVIQARTASTRLPGKVLLPAAGAPLLQRMIERVRAARLVSEVVVATTHALSDDAIAELAARVKVRLLRGHATDLLDRHAWAARGAEADAIVRIPSDCPLIDPGTIDTVIDAFVRLSDIGPVDMVSNLHPPTWPAGFDVEVIARHALEAAWRDATDPHDRAHVTPYLRANPARFAVRNACRDGADYDLARRYRLALEYPEDYGIIRGIYDDLWSPRRHFTLAEILAVLASRPALHARNAMHPATWFRGASGW